jgi:hypothetical protein
MTGLLAAALAAAIIGFLSGAIYFAWLWRSVASLAACRQAPMTFAAGAVLRLGSLALAVGALLWLGLEPLFLLVGGIGFLAARAAATAVLARGRPAKPAGEV